MGITPSIAESVPAINNRTSVSEGRLNVVGVDAASLDGFVPFTSVTGETVRIQDLSDNQALINDRAAEALDASPGDELTLFLGKESASLQVAAVVERNGLAGRDPTLLIDLERAQRLFDRPEQVNLISVSNRGGEIDGATLSREVTRELRAALSDRERGERTVGALETAGGNRRAGGSGAGPDRQPQGQRRRAARRAATSRGDR